MNKRGYLEISFSWIFALIVGAFILFLAIFFLVKLINTSENTADIKTAKEIGIITNPMETSFEEGKVSVLRMPLESRIYFDCSESGTFGSQRIKVQEKIKGKYTETDLEAEFESKYFFAERPVEGKTFYLFSKPFYFPFKSGSLIYVIPSEKSYCFLETPEEIEEEITNLGLTNIIFKEEDCLENSIRICFEDNLEFCDINVDFLGGFVEKSNEKIYFVEDYSLMYAGIFSNPEIYECQLNRLIKRTKILAEIYQSKIEDYSQSECTSNSIYSELNFFKNQLSGYSSSSDLITLEFSKQELQSVNEHSSSCRQW